MFCIVSILTQHENSYSNSKEKIELRRLKVCQLSILKKLTVEVASF